MTFVPLSREGKGEEGGSYPLGDSTVVRDVLGTWS